LISHQRTCALVFWFLGQTSSWGTSTIEHVYLSLDKRVFVATFVSVFGKSLFIGPLSTTIDAENILPPFDVLSLSLSVTSHADMVINISNLVKHLHVQHVNT